LPRTTGEVGERLGDDVADRHARVQRGEGILEDHLEVLALLAQRLSVQPGEVDTLEEHLTRRRRGSRVSTRASVDFPHPDSPTRPTVSPARISKLTPSTALQMPPPDVEVLHHVDDAEQRLAGRRGWTANGRRLGGARAGHDPGASGSGSEAASVAVAGGPTPLATPGRVSSSEAAPISAYARFIVTQQAPSGHRPTGFSSGPH
jgi:hypothetical protein